MLDKNADDRPQHSAEPVHGSALRNPPYRVDLVVRGKDGQAETVQYQKLTPMLLNEVQRLNRLLQAEKDRNLAQAGQLQTQADALKAEQSKNEIQTKEIAALNRQVILVQAQAKQMEALAVRLSRLEAKDAPGPVADASEPKK